MLMSNDVYFFCLVFLDFFRVSNVCYLSKSEVRKMVIFLCGRSQGRTPATISFLTQVKLPVYNFVPDPDPLFFDLPEPDRLAGDTDPDPSILRAKIVRETFISTAL